MPYLKRLHPSLLLLFLCLVGSSLAIFRSPHYFFNLNNLQQPVIGIVSLPPSPRIKSKDKKWVGMIPSSYRKWIEQTGARAAVIPHFASKSHLKSLVGKLNGILFTGGFATPFDANNKPTELMEKIGYIYNLGLEQNKKSDGDFPMWGTCFGFEAMMFHESGNKVKFSEPETYDEVKKLHFIDREYKKSMFSQYMRNSIKRYLSKNKVSYYNHHYGIRVKDFNASKKLTEKFRLIAYYKKKGAMYVSAVQHKRYPIVGVQFHPEKTLFEHKNSVNSKLTLQSSMASQEMARMIFGPALPNLNRFSSSLELEKYLFNRFVTVRSEGAFESVYLFTKEHFDWRRYKKTKVLTKKWLKSK